MMNTLVTQDAYDRIDKFLSQYVEPVGSGIPRDMSYFKDAIALLLKEHIFSSIENMKLECLRNYEIIIPDFLFGKEYPDG